jgi:hypothetical protein
MLYPGSQKDDSIHQGRMIIIGINLALVGLWVVEFFTYPIHLVPGFLFDGSGHTLAVLVGLLLRLGLMTICGLLLWAGVGWMRIVYGILLLLGGLMHLVLSIMLDSRGGVELLCAAIELTSAAALFISLSVEAYLKDRRARGIPWMSLAFSALGVLLLVGGVSILQLGLTYRDFLTSRERTEIAGDLLEKFASALDANVIIRSSTEDYQKTLEQISFSDQCADLHHQLGDFLGMKPLPEPTFAAITRSPPADQINYLTRGYFQKADALFYVTLDFSTGEPQVVYISISTQALNTNSTP